MTTRIRINHAEAARVMRALLAGEDRVEVRCIVDGIETRRSAVCLKDNDHPMFLGMIAPGFYLAKDETVRP